MYVLGMLTNISDIMGDSRLVNVPLVYVTETQLSSTTVLRDGSSTYAMARNDDKFKSLLVLYDKHSFECLEQENFGSVSKINFSTTLCNLCYFSMLVVYKKTIQILQNLLGTLLT